MIALFAHHRPFNARRRKHSVSVALSGSRKNHRTCRAWVGLARSCRRAQAPAKARPPLRVHVMARYGPLPGCGGAAVIRPRDHDHRAVAEAIHRLHAGGKQAAPPAPVLRHHKTRGALKIIGAETDITDLRPWASPRRSGAAWAECLAACASCRGVGQHAWFCRRKRAHGNPLHRAIDRSHPAGGGRL